jgi:hypothetical protein
MDSPNRYINPINWTSDGDSYLQSKRQSPDKWGDDFTTILDKKDLLAKNIDPDNPNAPQLYLKQV